MDKEAQKKIDLHFTSELVPRNIRDSWGATSLTQRLQMGQAIVELLHSLGYRKLPKDKPPLSGIVCPFCGQEDFDLLGLKYHLSNYCNVYQNTEDLPL